MMRSPLCNWEYLFITGVSNFCDGLGGYFGMLIPGLVHYWYQVIGIFTCAGYGNVWGSIYDLNFMEYDCGWILNNPYGDS